MSNSAGTKYRFTIWGQSHAPAIGVTIDGLPAGFRPDMEKLSRFLARRAPGNGPFSTTRKEADAPVFLAGLTDGHTCGAPVTAVIELRDDDACLVLEDGHSHNQVPAAFFILSRSNACKQQNQKSGDDTASAHYFVRNEGNGTRNDNGD